MPANRTRPTSRFGNKTKAFSAWLDIKLVDRLGVHAKVQHTTITAILEDLIRDHIPVYQAVKKERAS